MFAIGRRLGPVALAGSTAVFVGALLARQPQVAVLALCIILGACALSAPTAYWVGAAVIASLSFKGLSTLGLLPSVASLVDIPLAWGALAVAATRAQRLDRFERSFVALVLALGSVTVLSSFFSGFDLIRAILFYCLIGQPFAIAGALILDRPTESERRFLERLLLVVVAVQIPASYFQVVLYGQGDDIKGTLWGAGAGHHVVAAVIVLGCVWIATSPTLSRPVKLLLLVCLAPIPFLADAKQVILALPAALLVTRWASVRDFMSRISVIAVPVLILLLLIPAGRIALTYLDDARHGRTSKQHTAAFVMNKMEGDPASALLGLGPAESVSRAAFMTTEELLSADSPLRALGLEPARVATQARALGVLQLGGEVSSFQSGLSSGIGVLGDIGVVGLAIYLALWLLLLVRVRGSDRGTGAATGIALLLVLGVVFDWWEQPPFTVFVGCFVGLAASTARRKESFAEFRGGVES